MFVKAIETTNQFTRPIHTIVRYYGSDKVIPSAASLFFINDEGCALTCKHVVELIIKSEQLGPIYTGFKSQLAALSVGRKYKRREKELLTKYNFTDGSVVQCANRFMNCVDKTDNLIIKVHPNLDIAVIKFEGYSKLSYKGHATLLKDTSKIKQGKSLCRLGYPFPEFTNYRYDPSRDVLEWITDGRDLTPTFPSEGMITRNVQNHDGKITGIEMRTPGLIGQSGGPLFDQDGIIYGMQASTHHLHMGFDISGQEILTNGIVKKVSNYPFVHLGNCVHIDSIKEFLADNNIEYTEA